MKLEKIQTEILKAGMKKLLTNKETPWVITYDEKKDMVYITERHFVMNIPGKFFLLDIDILEEIINHPLSIKAIETMYRLEDEAEPAIRTTEMRKLDKGEVVKFETEDKVAWFDTKFLKYFEDDAILNITGEKTPGFVYEEDKLVGVILPVVVK